MRGLVALWFVLVVSPATAQQVPLQIVDDSIPRSLTG